MPKIIVTQPFKFAHHGYKVEEFEVSMQPRETTEECAALAIAEGWAEDAEAAEQAAREAAEQAAREAAEQAAREAAEQAAREAAEQATREAAEQAAREAAEQAARDSAEQAAQGTAPSAAADGDQPPLDGMTQAPAQPARKRSTRAHDVAPHTAG